MTHYIDGFVLPLPRNQLDVYKDAVEKIAEIWKEHGALDYSEFVIDDTGLEGTRSFSDFAGASKDETIVFGWVVFESRGARDVTNERVAADPRMTELIGPLTHASRPIFDAERMVYGGFQSLVQLSNLNA
jgi:uncharacterized protein YbaA (DUF1428 family)